LQIDTTTIIAGGAILFIGIIIFWWFSKRSQQKKVDSTLQNLVSIVGNEGGPPGYKYARTGEPQLLMELEPQTKCTSLIVQYGHYDGDLGGDKKALNVAAYHANQELKTNFFVRPTNRRSPLAPRRGPRVLTGNAAFDEKFTIEHGDNADNVVKDPGFQQSLNAIPNLLFFEVRQEGVKTLIWGEMRGTSTEGAKAIYETIKKVADLL
jgi:hypothetical protein